MSSHLAVRRSPETSIKWNLVSSQEKVMEGRLIREPHSLFSFVPEEYIIISHPPAKPECYQNNSLFFERNTLPNNLRNCFLPSIMCNLVRTAYICGVHDEHPPKIVRCDLYREGLECYHSKEGTFNETTDYSTGICPIHGAQNPHDRKLSPQRTWEKT